MPEKNDAYYVDAWNDNESKLFKLNGELNLLIHLKSLMYLHGDAVLYLADRESKRWVLESLDVKL